MSSRLVLAGTAALLACAACSHAPAASSPLLGFWMAHSQNGFGSSFEFRDNGTATWNLQVPFEIQYRVESGPAPRTLDLFGFETGPLQGRTLYCLIELSANDRLRMDCEPTARPTTFDAKQTQEFVHSRRAR